MKKKLRELRRKRIFVKLCKGALRISYTYGLFKDTCTIKKKGNNSRFKKGLGFALDTDIGIAKYHFEVASGKDSSIWG